MHAVGKLQLGEDLAQAPVDEAAAEELVRSLASAPLLTGVRGRPPLDVAAAARAVAALSRFAAAHPEVAAVEVNPLLVRREGQGVVGARRRAFQPSSSGSMRSRMTRIGKSELVYPALEPVDDILARIDAVTVDDVREVAKSVLAQPTALAVVRPYAEADPFGPALRRRPQAARPG